MRIPDRPLQIALLSGKGGTGKSTLTASLFYLIDNSILVDCDVDAPDQRLIFPIETLLEEGTYRGAEEPRIDNQLCTLCGTCAERCAFDALELSHDRSALNFIEERCEGCALCYYVCPYNAIEMVERVAGTWKAGISRKGLVVYGELRPGEEVTGKLIRYIRAKAEQLAREKDIEILLLDGPPGSSCPAISTITGVDHVIIVAEPSKTGLSDMLRIKEIIEHFKINYSLVINKWDLNPQLSDELARNCKEPLCKVLGKIPYNSKVAEVINSGLTPIEAGPQEIRESIMRIFENLCEEL